MGYAGADAISHMLVQNTSIVDLDLSLNSLGPDGKKNMFRIDKKYEITQT